ncbi:MAG: phosphoribosylformylglycinamidine synthase subunit PurS [Melioribacteraceae bacterium]|nr:phosphoribosylformylglycinamidine synthase subunit PurS [Melioribacteraceae bacterium]MCO6474406.1 phosphoribosylformylglycinamidine synthase subunit PurS [Melioribacteraceae bacterium]
MYKVNVIIKRRPKILDPQGKAVEQGAKMLGFSNINGTRIGKFIEFFVNTDDREIADKEIKEYCEKLLANPIMEDFEYSVEEVK